jgi:predicted MFS family arabinose efflux permease
MTDSKSLPPARIVTAVTLVGLTGAWNAGTVGPVANEIAAEFGLSLAVVGVLAGTLFLGSCVVALFFAAQFGERRGLVQSLRVACALSVAGNLLFAVAPVFAGLAVGRIIPGLGFALANTLGAVWARNAGGVRLVGIFGASIQLGVAAALLTGSGLADLGIDWRVGFVISAALGAVAFVAIPKGAESPPAAPHQLTQFFRIAMVHARVYRLALLFISIYGVPMILSAWLIQFLYDEGGIRTSLGGLVAFLSFGVSAAVRVFGASLEAWGISHVYLTGALGLSAIGLAAIALEPTVAIAFAGVILLGIGFGIPYATALTEAQELYPEAPGEPMALMTLFALIPPVAVIPLVGHAISIGHGDVAFGALAVLLLLATLLNLRRSGIPLTEPGKDPE